MIFPEGAVNNGCDLMNFKAGAFEDFAPLRIYVMQFYGSKTPSWNLMTEAEIVFYQLSNWSFPVKLHEFGNFDPQYTLDRHGIDKNHPDAVKLIIEDIYYLIEYGTSVRAIKTASFQEKCVMETYCVKNIPNGLSYKPVDLNKIKKSPAREKQHIPVPEVSNIAK